MRKKNTPLWPVMLIVMTLVLTACVRPVPTPPTNTPFPTIEIAIVATPLPTAEPPVVLPTNTPDPTLPTNTPVPQIITEQPGTQIYIVQLGDSLGVIAATYNTTIAAIQQANNLGSSTLIYPGDELIIPGADFKPTDPVTPQPPENKPAEGENNNATADGQGGGTGKVHIVQPGENLFRIGYNNGCSTQQMAKHNNIANPWYIYPGQEIRIPSDC